MTLIASIPILIILVLMIGFRWGAARSGAAGYLAAFFIAVVFFGAGAKKGNSGTAENLLMIARPGPHKRDDRPMIGDW